MSKCPFNHGTTAVVVDKINQQDGCPVKATGGSIPEANKQEYYQLLLKFLPVIVEIMRNFREHFLCGLVVYKDPNLGPHYSNLTTGINEDFQQKIAKAFAEKYFLRCSYIVHNAIAVSVDIATELWAHMEWDNPDQKRLLQLVDNNRQQMYGKKAAQKRISSAMIQTLHISASFERFIYNFMADKNIVRSEENVLSYHSRTLKTALSLTELHLERTREMRPVFGAEIIEDGIIHRYIDPSYFYLSDKRLELKEDSLLEAMTPRPIDASDGRIGCPGKKHISEVWRWIELVSKVYSYPALGL